MIYSRTVIDKQRFKSVLNCKYPLKSGNRFQLCLIWDDNSVYQMLKLVNTTGMEEIELYIKVVRVKPQVNQYVGAYIDLLVAGNDNVAKLDYGCGPSSALIPDIDRCEVYEDDKDCEDEEANNESDEDGDESEMFKLMDMFHPSILLTKFWKMSKGYMSMWMRYLVMYQIT